MHPKFKSIVCLFSCLTLIFLLAACGNGSVEPEAETAVTAVGTPVVNIVTNPVDVEEVLPDQQVTISIEASGSNLTFEWQEGRGTLSKKDGVSAIYTAPTEPGPDNVDIIISSDDGNTTRSVPFNIMEPRLDKPESEPDTESENIKPTEEIVEKVGNEAEPSSTPLSTNTPIPSPTPLPPIACNHTTVTNSLFPQLTNVNGQFPFYGPVDEPLFTCHGVFDRFHSEPLSVKLTYKSAEENGGFWGIGGFKDGFDATGFEKLCFWAYTELPLQAFRLQMKDLNNTEQGVTLSVDIANEWMEICTPLSQIAEQGVQLSRLENVNLNFNAATQDAVIWVDNFEFR